MCQARGMGRLFALPFSYFEGYTAYTTRADPLWEKGFGRSLTLYSAQSILRTCSQTLRQWAVYTYSQV